MRTSTLAAFALALGHHSQGEWVMFKGIRLAVYTAIFAFCSISMGGIEPASAATPDLRGLAYESLGTYTSQPGDTLAQFLERVRPTIRAFIDRTGFEACAEIAQTADGKGWGIVLGSSDSRIGCAVAVARVPVGMAPTGVTIHGHPTLRRLYPNPNDIVLLSAMGMDADAASIMREDPDHFSPGDYAGGPGYLATPTGLLYQDGHPGSAHVVQP